MGLCPIVSTTYCSSDAYTYVVVNDGKRGYRLHTWVYGTTLTLLGLGLIKINEVSANFNNPRPSLILNN